MSYVNAPLVKTIKILRMLQQLRKHIRGGGSNGNIGVKIVNNKIEIKVLTVYTYDLQK